MKILVHFQIPEDGRELFNAFEDHVLPLLTKHGGQFIDQFISKTGDEEFHIIEFPNQQSLEAYQSDPDRIAALPLWEQSDATSRIVQLA
ncbi:MAG: hypothetical protein ACKVQS_08340 [Fimbriimonadaceae bacterium]